MPPARASIVLGDIILFRAPRARLVPAPLGRRAARRLVIGLAQTQPLER